MVELDILLVLLRQQVHGRASDSRHSIFHTPVVQPWGCTHITCGLHASVGGLTCLVQGGVSPLDAAPQCCQYCLQTSAALHTKESNGDGLFEAIDIKYITTTM